MTTFQLDLTYGIKLIEHFFEVPLKAQLFGAPNIYNVIM